VIWAAMLAGDKPFNDEASPHIEPLDPVEGFGVQIVV